MCTRHAQRPFFEGDPDKLLVFCTFACLGLPSGDDIAARVNDVLLSLTEAGIDPTDLADAFVSAGIGSGGLASAV